MDKNQVCYYDDSSKDEVLKYAFAMTLRQLRQDKYSHRQMAEMLNCNRSSYSYWESGKRLPPINMMFRLCEIFDVSPCDFFALIKKYKAEKEKENEQQC